MQLIRNLPARWTENLEDSDKISIKDLFGDKIILHLENNRNFHFNPKV